MAIDTRDKRASVIGLDLPSGRVLPLPGTLDSGDRLHLALLYRGIAASSPTPSTPPPVVGRVMGRGESVVRVRGAGVASVRVVGRGESKVRVMGEGGE